MAAPKTLSIVVPVLNEEEAIANFLERVLKTAQVIRREGGGIRCRDPDRR